MNESQTFPGVMTKGRRRCHFIELNYCRKVLKNEEAKMKEGLSHNLLLIREGLEKGWLQAATHFLPDALHGVPCAENHQTSDKE